MNIMTGLIKTMAYAIAALMAITFISAIVGAFVFGMESGIDDGTIATPIATPSEFFNPHSKYAEAYIPSITEIGDGQDWYMTKKDIEAEGLVCTAIYTKDGHRTVNIMIIVLPTINDAKELYNKGLANAPYVECPTMGVCDQSFQYVKEVPTSEYSTKEVGTGIIRDGNIIVIFGVTEDNMFFGLNSNDMERYAKNIEKKINAVAGSGNYP